jgi:hypothetical protein
MYVKFLPNQYILRYRKGKLVGEGAGLAFFCIESVTAVSAVPVGNCDLDFVLETLTRDNQKVTVQAQMTYRAVDYKRTAAAMDFTVDLRTKKYNNNPMQKIDKRLANFAGVYIRNSVGRLDLTEAIKPDTEIAAEALAEFRKSAELKAMGIEVCGFSVIRVSAEPDTARALEATAREQILKQSDDALYERRNASIEQERRVKENELNTDISVEEKKKKIREAEIATKRMMLERETELERIKVESEAKRREIRLDAEIALERKRRELADLKLENTRKEADADAYRVRTIMEAYSAIGSDTLIALATLGMEPEKLIAQAFDKLAAGSGKIGTLNITPDLLESLTNRR